MARKDYYLILGVSRGENIRGIQEAFRDLARDTTPLGPVPQKPIDSRRYRNLRISIQCREKKGV